MFLLQSLYSIKEALFLKNLEKEPPIKNYLKYYS